MSTTRKKLQTATCDLTIVTYDKQRAEQSIAELKSTYPRFLVSRIRGSRTEKFYDMQIFRVQVSYTARGANKADIRVGFAEQIEADAVITSGARIVRHDS